MAERAAGRPLSRAEFVSMAYGGWEMGLTIKGIQAVVPDYYKQKAEREREVGHSLSNSEFESEYLVTSGRSSLSDSGTSVFDPCLCEMDYAWFTAVGDRVLDPFAGGSVRGIVAQVMGREYVGIDLREEQVEANREQAEEICEGARPTWLVGDSLEVDSMLPGEMFDHILTCPPYGDLEVYSEDPRDLSNMPAEDFDAAYASIMAAALGHLREDRFATVVVGNYRDGSGFVRDLVGLTVRAMEAAGARYYNDMVLVTPAGSLPIRAGRQFRSTRKVGRTHQYVLNFVKGDPRAATARLGDVLIPELVEEGA